jgi:membrane protein
MAAPASSPSPSPSAPPSATPEQEAFFRRYVDAAKHTGHRVWDFANQVTNGYVAFLVQAIRNFIAKGMQESAMFAYWAMFSLFPLVMLGIVAATFLFGAAIAKTQIYAQLNNVIPGGVSSLVRSNLDQAFTHRDGFGVFAILGLIYGSFGLFTALQRNLSRIFRDEQPRSLARQLLTDLVMIATLGALVCVSILASVAFAGVASQYSQLIIKRSPLFALGALALPLIVNALIFGLLFRYIPRHKISWRALLPAAIFAGVAWELCKAIFGWYIQNLANFGILYGSLGTVMALLAWTYLTGAFISLWGELAVATDDWLSRRPPAVTINASPVNKLIHELTSEEREHSSAPDEVQPDKG